MAAFNSTDSLLGSVEFRQSGAANGPRSLVAVACAQAFDLFERLSFPVLEMNLRGYGGSRVSPVSEVQKNDDPFQLSHYMADFDTVLRKGNLKSTALLGYSHSGYFATSYALAKPEKVSALILVEPALFNSREDLLNRAKLAAGGRNEKALMAMLRHVQPSVGLDDKAASAMVKTILENVNDDRTLASEYTVRAENPIEESELKKLEMPVLLIGGKRSHASYTVERLARILPQASVWWVRGAQHIDLMTPKFAQQINKVVSQFLESLD